MGIELTKLQMKKRQLLKQLSKIELEIKILEIQAERKGEK